MAAGGVLAYKELKLGKLLGRGAFGEVRLGTYRGYYVAVKHLISIKHSRGGSAGLEAEEVEEFRKEAELMKNLSSHDNVLALVGTTKNRKSTLLFAKFSSY